MSKSKHLEAYFSDGTIEYRNPPECQPGDLCKIRFRAAADDNCKVQLHHEGHSVMVMQPVETIGCFTYYETTIPIGHDLSQYYFVIHSDEQVIYFDKKGCSSERRPQYFFNIIPGFTVPDWAKGAVMYQILVDSFANGDESNDVITGEYVYLGNRSNHKAWNELPNAFSVFDFYGGDLAGVLSKLDYLKSLGVEVLYLNPIFVSPSNHKYDAQDYNHIDPHYGVIVRDEGELVPEGAKDNTKATRYINRVTGLDNLEASDEFFAFFVSELHKRGMRIILDAVLNHCGSFGPWMDREGIYGSQEGYEVGAFASADSPYRSYFAFNDNNAWPNNSTYDGWWGNDTLPKLNYEESPELEEAILQIAEKWLRPPYNIDGWRLDVAADLGHSPEYNHKFWQKFRRRVRAVNENAIILAEHYGDVSPWLRGNEWDTVMNYDAFMEPVTYFLTGMEKHGDRFEEHMLGNAEAFIGTMKENMARFHNSSLMSAMNELSNHDHSRFMTRTNQKVGRLADLGSAAASEDTDDAIFRAAVLMQMTWPGAPTIYYGDEAGLCGFTDPDNRRPYPWGHVRRELIDYHRDLINIRRYSYTLRSGSFAFLPCEKDVLCYGRFSKNDQYVIIVNISEEDKELELPVWQIGVPLEANMKLKVHATSIGFSTMPLYYRVVDGVLKIAVSPKVSLMLKHADHYDGAAR